MKLKEIDDLDRTWAVTAGINLDIDTDFKEATEILRLLLKLKSPHRNNFWIPRIEQIEYNINRIIDAQLNEDESTMLLKNKATGYLQES
jgi:hypothetical protein